MVGAHESLRLPEGLGTDARAAVATHIDHGVEAAVSVAGHDDRLARDVVDQMAGAFRDLTGVSRVEPVAHEETVNLPLEHRRIAVEGLFQGETRPVPRREGLD